MPPRRRPTGIAALGVVLAVLCAPPLGARSYITRNPRELAEESDYWVHAEILRTQRLPLDGSRLFADDFEQRSLELRVIRAAPELPVDRLPLDDAFFNRDAKLMKRGSQWILAVTRRRSLDGTLHYGALREVYRVEARKKKVTLRAPWIRAPLEETWRLCVDLKSLVHSSYAAEPETVKYWQEQLTSESLPKKILATHFVTSLIAPPPIGNELVAAIARHDRRSGTLRETFVRKAMTALEFVADAASAEALLEYSLRRSRGRRRIDHSSALNSVAAVLARAGKKRRKLLQKFLDHHRRPPVPDNAESVITETYEQLSRFPGRDIDGLLLRAYRRELAERDENSRRLRMIVDSLARRGAPRIRDDLAEHFEKGARSKLARAGLDLEAAEHVREAYLRSQPRSVRVTAYAKRLAAGDHRVLPELHHNLTTRDTELVPLLSQLTVEGIRDDYSLDSFAQDVAEFFPERAFLPLLRGIAQVEPSGDVFRALRVCGDPMLAKTEALKMWSSTEHLYQRRRLVLFLGTTADPALLPELERTARRDSIDEDDRAREVGAAAILAIARIGGPDAVRRLRGLQEHKDVGVQLRAELGLFYLKESTGAELIERVRKHDELAHPDILSRWNTDFMHSGSIVAALVYLRAPHTDRLLLDRIGVRYDRMDSGLRLEPAFVADHRNEVLSICVQHLSSRFSDVRFQAHWLLRLRTHRDFGFQHDAPPAQRDEAKRKWKRWVDREVAGR